MESLTVLVLQLVEATVIFASSDTKKLVSSWLLLSLCQQRLLVDLGAGVLGQSWICKSPDTPVSRAILAAVRETAFAHFCGGESLEDCVPLAKQLQDAAGVRCIVDWGVEESCDPGAWESNADRKVDTWLQAKKILGASAAFMPIKPTSLLSPVLLERITAITEDGASKLTEDFRSQLAPADRLEVDEALSRLRRICQAAKDAAVPLLLDAEHSHRQPAVHLLAQELQKEFNRDKAVVYDTIQMYLAASPGRLEKALEKAERDNYTCAIKLASKVLRQGLTQMQLLQEKETGAKGKGNDHLDRTLTKIEESVRYQAQGARKPWLDEDGKVIWSTSRIKVAKFVFSQVFETIMGFIIIVNLYLIMREQDSDANCITTYGSLEETCPTRSSAIVYLRVANILLLTIYSLECVVRFYVERSGFFCNTWNMIDLITVLLGIVSALPLNTGPNLGLLRLSRLVRVMRAARVFISIPELYLLISGLYSSIKAIFFGSLMLFFVLVIWAVISVELLHPTPG
eukprot:s695_g6.t1